MSGRRSPRLQENRVFRMVACDSREKALHRDARPRTRASAAQDALRPRAVKPRTEWLLHKEALVGALAWTLGMYADTSMRMLMRFSRLSEYLNAYSLCA